MLKEIIARIQKKASLIKNHKSLVHYRSLLTKGSYTSDSGREYKYNVKNVIPHFVESNKKIKWTEKQAFLIFSLPPVLTCPNACSGCLEDCYALKEMYPQATLNRFENWKLSLRDDFPKIVIAWLESWISKNEKRLKGRKLAVRVHESGDFYSIAYMLKWYEIARHFPQVTFYAYTKSFKIADECEKERPENFTVRASVWNGSTTREEAEIIAKNQWPIYTAYEKDKMPENYFICPCSAGCGTCGNQCGKAAQKNIACEIH